MVSQPFKNPSPKQSYFLRAEIVWSLLADGNTRKARKRDPSEEGNKRVENASTSTVLLSDIAKSASRKISSLLTPTTTMTCPEIEHCLFKRQKKNAFEKERKTQDPSLTSSINRESGKLHFEMSSETWL